jgi:inner membrane protein
MMSRTHAVFGAACWAAACVYFHFPLHLAGLLVAAAASFLPDIDHPQSTLGRHVRLISIPLSRVWGHRGVTHSAAAVAAIILVLHHYHLSGQKWIWPIAVGYSSHILGDFVTRSGIAFFWPLKLRISIGLWRTDGAVEVVVRNCLVLLLCWFSLRAWM